MHSDACQSGRWEIPRPSTHIWICCWSLQWQSLKPVWRRWRSLPALPISWPLSGLSNRFPQYHWVFAVNFLHLHKYLSEVRSSIESKVYKCLQRACNAAPICSTFYLRHLGTTWPCGFLRSRWGRHSMASFFVWFQLFRREVRKWNEVPEHHRRGRNDPRNAVIRISCSRHLQQVLMSGLIWHSKNQGLIIQRMPTVAH